MKPKINTKALLEYQILMQWQRSYVKNEGFTMLKKKKNETNPCYMYIANGNISGTKVLD